MAEAQFIKKVGHVYAENKRPLTWRDIERLTIRERGYRVVVSELMLQQTQVQRVIPKYNEWMQRWPTIDDFSHAHFADVISIWSGLGYNRRAQYLYTTLRSIIRDCQGIVPNDVTTLLMLPGIGLNTAGAIIVYTYNSPQIFIETNIRTVYLHEFFADTAEQITDTQLKEKLAVTLDIDNPRQWYYALMDYGAYVKQKHGSHLQRSVHYKKQPIFKGSNRQIRGAIIHILAREQSVEIATLKTEIADIRLDTCIQSLSDEGMIIIDGETLRLPHDEMV